MTNNRLSRNLCLVFTTVLLGLPAIGRANLADADAAYEKGDYFAAFREYLPHAKNGEAAGQAAIGRIYLEGKGAPKDARAAAMQYEKAAAQGHAGAQFQFAKMLAGGVGVKADPERAAKLMEQSAEQGVVWAMHAIGLMYRDGAGLAKDAVQANKWLDLAASSSMPAPATEYIEQAKTAKARLESSMTTEQIGAAPKLASAWRTAKRPPATTIWQKPINWPIAVHATGDAAANQGERSPAPDEKPRETTPLTRDYFPRS